MPATAVPVPDGRELGFSLLVERAATVWAPPSDGRVLALRWIAGGVHGAVLDAPQHPYTRRLLASRPQRNVVEELPPPGTAPVLQTQDLGVSYPVPLPGWRGWFRQGRFEAVRGVTLQLLPGRTLGVTDLCRHASDPNHPWGGGGKEKTD